MKARGDAISILLVVHEWKYDEDLGRETLWTTKVGTVWRRPYTIMDGDSIKTVIRINYKLYYLHNNKLFLSKEDKELFESDPGRYGGELYE